MSTNLSLRAATSIFTEDGYGRSEQTEFYGSGYAGYGGTRDFKETGYSYDMAGGYMNDNYLSIFDISSSYYIASRCILDWGDDVSYSVFTISGSTLGTANLMSSGDDRESMR